MIRSIPFLVQDAYHNMAMDEYFFYCKEADSVPILRFYKWHPSSATIGRNQSMDEEVDIEYADSKGIQYTRRITGGGAVLHSSNGELTYMFVCPKSILDRVYNRLIDSGKFYSNSNEIPRYYVPILESLIVGLQALGLSLDINKLNCPALKVGEKKISGNAQAMRSDVVLQHGTLLLSVNPEEMYSVLKVPEYTTKKNIVLSVKAKVGGLKDFLPVDLVEIDKLCECLKKGFCSVFGMEYKEVGFSDAEILAVESLAKKYRDKEWIFKK